MFLYPHEEKNTVPSGNRVYKIPIIIPYLIPSGTCKCHIISRNYGGSLFIMTATNRDITTPPKLSKELQTLLDEYRALREEMESHEAELSRLQSRQYAIKGEIAALEIPPLKAEMEANTEKIAHLEERKRYFEIDLKIREAQKKELLRKQRNRRIFTRGGMLESFLQEPLIMTDDEVHDFLLEVFRMPEVDALLRKVLEQCRRNLENVSEEDSETEPE